MQPEAAHDEARQHVHGQDRAPGPQPLAGTSQAQATSNLANIWAPAAAPQGFLPSQPEAAGSH